ncbi:hypothetical protein GQ44DRAFT_711204 [Phaeosphaeriaceae sp. PMI808]|nr:hypothetical protein GQ44DRAFT_711204 [Phaeosphaeriaceae sp. PMI808]
MHRLYKKILSSADSLEVRDLARWWYQECQQGHAKCSFHAVTGDTTQPKWYPPCLLDILPEYPHLISRENLKYGEAFAALSHCWGQDPFLTLAQGDIERYGKEGINPDTMPENFRSVVKIFQGLGYVMYGSTRSV